MIGILKAMGASNKRIQSIFFGSAFYLILLGILLGNVFGIGIGLLQAHTHLLQLDQQSYYMNFVPIQFNWLDLTLVNLGTLAVCLLAMMLPAVLVTKISPVKAIRFK
jgi:lipoprotein-releasing system permease protein